MEFQIRNINEEIYLVYSSGDVKRDKIPKKSVVEYFHNKNYFNVSTNFVYGLVELYGTPIVSSISRRSLLLGTRSSIRSSTLVTTPPLPRFFGDKKFTFSL
jgi:hypothetical protein